MKKDKINYIVIRNDKLCVYMSKDFESAQKYLKTNNNKSLTIIKI